MLYLSHQNVEQGGFSCSRRADDRENLPGFHHAADALKDILYSCLAARKSGLGLRNRHAEADIAKPQVDLLDRSG